MSVKATNSTEKLKRYVEQCIQERANLGHLYQIEDGPDGPEAALTDCAAASLWRAVQDAIREAGWRITAASGNPDIATTTPPETEYGRRLRARGYKDEADLLDRLILRERVCDSQCGAMQAVADAWYRAEKEFDLSDDDPYEAIKRLRAMIDHLGRLVGKSVSLKPAQR
jgi:hypothetical protein